MTNREAVAATIEPYSVSDDALDKALIDASERFGEFAPDDNYSLGAKKCVALASMLCLARLRVLTAENIGGISQNYDVSKLDKAIKAIANDAGISPDLVASDEDNIVTYFSI